MHQNTPSQKQDDMFRMIKAWQECGTTQKSFYQERGLKPSVFYYWLRKYRESGTNDDRFIPLDLSPVQEKHNSFACVLEYPDGTVLRLDIFPGITDLIRLLRMR